LDKTSLILFTWMTLYTAATEYFVRKSDLDASRVRSSGRQAYFVYPPR
jgi:hypothetical protein